MAKLAAKPPSAPATTFFHKQPGFASSFTIVNLPVYDAAAAGTVRAAMMTAMVRPSMMQKILLVLAALLFATSGAMHFVATEAFASIVPPYIPDARLVVYLSGLAEIAGAVGLLILKLRRWAGWGLVLLLICVFPANLYMAREGIQMPGHTIPPWALWARLPLQAVLIWWVWWCSKPRDPSAGNPGAGITCSKQLR